MSLHWIQNEILQTLYEADSLAFSKLKPANIGNDQFNYHLKRLVDDGYVSKEASEYSISDKGKAMLARQDGAGQTLDYPKTGVLVVIENSKGEFFLERRQTHPFKGLYMLPTARIRENEHIEDTARKVVKSLTGIPMDPEYKGVFRRVFQTVGGVNDDRLFLVYYAKVDLEGVDFKSVTELDSDRVSSNASSIISKLKDFAVQDILDHEGSDKRY